MSHHPPLPIVACIMLANGRPEMVKRAIASYRSQSYFNRELLILDTTPDALELPSIKGECHLWRPDFGKWSIGALRNMALTYCVRAEVFAHFDSDDWSHPRRLEEQVELMRVTGKDAVGYNDMLFWDTSWKSDILPPSGEAWLYESHHPTKFLGSSMLYKRKAWENSPFHPDEPNEDTLWWGTNQGRCAAVSSLHVQSALNSIMEPRMVCAIHGSNTSVAYSKPRVPAHWRRMPNWDNFCAKRML